MIKDTMKEIVTRTKHAMIMNRKGQMAGQVGLVVFIVSLVGVLITMGVAVLVLDAFNQSTTNAPAQTVFNNGITMLTNFTAQLGTVGTIGGILILVVLVALAGIGGFAFARNRGLV